MSFGSKSLAPPTESQLQRWALLQDVGCICCLLRGRNPAVRAIAGPIERHHQTVGGKHGAPRLGHWFTVALCAWHHRGEPDGVEPHVAEHLLGPSYARTPKAFRAEYGHDEWLLKTQNEMIGWNAAPVRERRKNRKTTAAANQVKRPASGFVR
jgi:hypothetical protein